MLVASSSINESATVAVTRPPSSAKTSMSIPPERRSAHPATLWPLEAPAGIDTPAAGAFERLIRQQCLVESRTTSH
jgi:hypothetical protein